jgi:hypothetical protein
MKHPKNKTMPDSSNKSKQNSTNCEMNNAASECTVSTYQRRRDRWKHNLLKLEPPAPIAREQLPLF